MKQEEGGKMQNQLYLITLTKNYLNETIKNNIIHWSVLQLLQLSIGKSFKIQWDGFILWQFLFLSSIFDF